jgi:outer membrane protein OmpA-like peptidoglycan-associated protein
VDKPAQTAEDAGVIADRRQREEKLVKAQLAASRASAQQAREEADAYAQQARIYARQRADADLDASREPAAVAPNTGLRTRLLDELNGVLATRDTPRGLVVTVSNAAFSGALLRGTAAEQVARVTAIVAAHPGLEIEVVGHTDSAATETLSWRRAEAVRRVILDYGLAPNAVAARGLGNTRPLDSNATAAGREQNRRTEIVISGDPIGRLPTWDRAYSLTLR